ncbi:MAG: VCBS repeat-containing protein [Burkholderiales bacterium]|nr:VCBS repeat-containing protein [Flavobacterium sp.]
MYFFKNTNGLGNFALENLTVFASMYAVYPADMDGDGDNDILGISLYGGNNSYAGVAWFENNNGVYAVGHDVSAIDARGESVQAADSDHDGDLDVLTSEGSALSWYSNNGVGTFGAREVIRVGFTKISKEY